MDSNELVEKLSKYKKKDLIEAFIEYMYSVSALGDKEDEEQHIFNTINAIIKGIK
jgi:hypothetical protein